MALWGGRFSEDAQDAVRIFTESISYDKRLYRHDICGSKAHAAMLGAAGIIPKKSSKAIIAELGKIEKMIEAGKMEFSSALEDIHMHIETELIRVLGNEGARVHTARSRNDQVALDIRLYLRDAVDSVVAGIVRLQKALVDQAYANRKTILPGF
ncbi:MAG: argininosuccinate lyase, partial [Lentisphaeria bacterium]|nr:argininosuccinate lyase [Lentisphaeria bacterium]